LGQPTGAVLAPISQKSGKLLDLVMPNNGQHSQAPAGQGPEIMAIVLEAQHGLYAAEVADFFAGLHTERGDASRSRAWTNVARRIRYRERERLEQA
jgi:hypothetical protein